MRVARCARSGLVCVVAMLAFASMAAAQALEQVPDGPVMLLKVNSPQGISQRLGAMTQRLGLAALEPGLANPLAAFKQQAQIQQGVNDKGQVVVALYEPAGGGRGEPRPFILIPVTDYKAFLGNFQGAARDGELDVVRLADAPVPFFSTQRGQYAALSPDRNLIGAPAGLKVAGAVGKALEERDATIFFNIPVIAKMALPQVRMIKGFMANAPAADPGQAAGMAMAGQVLNGMEQFLMQSRAAAIAMSFTAGGINSTFIGDFNEGSALANTVGAMKNTADPLLSGLPQAQYLALVGWTQGGQGMWDLFGGMYGPVLKQANLPADQAKQVQEYMDATRRFMMAMTGGSAGLLAPRAGDANSGLINGFFLFDGDAKAMVSANRTVLEGQDAFTRAMGQQGLTMKTTRDPAAKQVDGTALEQYTMEFNVEAGVPEAEMVRQIFSVLYGPRVTGYIGALNEKRMLSAINVSEAQLQQAVAAAKQDAKAAGESAGVKTAAAGLPAQRFMVGYISLDRIVTAVMDIGRRMGAPAPAIKFPADMAPLGVSMSSEGTAVRIDVSMPNSLIDGMVGAGMQAYMQQRRAAPGGL